MEPVTTTTKLHTYTASQIQKLFDDAWDEARADLYRELEQTLDERSEKNCLSQLRNLTKAKGRINVRIER